MSELRIQPSDPVDYLNSVGLLDEHALNTKLISDYNRLTRLLPYQVLQADRSFSTPQGMAHEYQLCVGEPAHAQSVFGGTRSLEVGGPSDYSKLRTVRGQFRPTIVTNIAKGKGVDELADATKLQYADRSFGAVLSMSLPGLQRSGRGTNVRYESLREAHRVLETNGWLLMQGTSLNDLEDALSLGFTLEAGNGCVVTWLTTNRVESSGQTLYTPPYTHLEILLHK